MNHDQNVIDDLALLKRMEKAGWITLQAKHGVHYSARKVQPRYVDQGPKLEGRSSFTYAGKKYQLKYFCGCFFPFVTLVINRESMQKAAAKECLGANEPPQYYR